MAKSTPKDSTPAQASSSTTQASTSSALEEQVSRAEQAVYKNQAASNTLQHQWKKHLLHLSYLLAVIGLHQWQSHVTPCLHEIKDFNNDANSITISGWEAIKIVLRDSMEYIVAFAMTCSLIYFLTFQQQPSQLSKRVSFSSSWSYMITNACVPVILGIHYQQRQGQQDQASSSSCLTDVWRYHQLTSRQLHPDATSDPSKQRNSSFPVIVLFHLIVTCSYWFMDVQAKQHERNIVLVEKLRRDLIERQQKDRNNTIKTSETKKQ